MKDELKNKFMSAFGIFALILTIAYIIYFIVVIVRDVAAGRKSGDDSSQTETFDTSFMEEQSVQVTETREGFSVGRDSRRRGCRKYHGRTG